MRVGFAGTPDFAIPALKALCDSPELELVCVYTQPDRPAGRGRQLSASPIKKFALERDLEILQPENFASSSTVDQLKSFSLDVLVVAAYGLILPQNVLDAVRYPVNIHASLLPRWRGAAPIQRSIMAGDAKTGVTVIRIVKKLDAGPMWLQAECPIESNETTASLHDKLAVLGGRAITDALNKLRHQSIIEVEQEEQYVTYAEKITTLDRALDFDRPGEELERKIRALNPVPVSTATLAEQNCKIWEATIDNEENERSRTLKPGDIAYARNDGIGIRVRDGILKLTSIQPPGKKPMRVQDFLNGYGDRLNPAKS